MKQFAQIVYRRLRATSAFSPLKLFAQGEQGGFYDFSDLSVMFQDAAGTTPVTAVEQPVGLVLDKSGRGNHLSQSTSASRPVLSARVNLLTRTEAFDNAAWTKTNMTVLANTTETTDPLGGNTSDILTENSTAGTFITPGAITVGNGAVTTYSVAVKYKNNRWFRLLLSDDAANSLLGWFDVQNGVLGSVSSTGASSPSSSITSLGNGWYRCSVTAGFAAASRGSSLNNVSADASSTRVNNGASYIWGADLRVANAGVNLPAYQRVVTATDYDTTGFPMYLKFDGTDDSLSSAAINFTSTDKMSVFAGVRKVSDALRGVVFELSDNLSNNNGAAYLFAPQSDGKGNYQFASKGTTASFLDGYTGDNNNYPAPQTRVVTGLTDIGAPSLALRLNGSVAVSGTSTQGTGNFGNYPLHVGRRGGSTLPFNGHIYSLIVRGAATDAATITATETWVNGKTYAYGPPVPTTANNLIWASGNNLIWDTGNNITWGNS